MEHEIITTKDNVSEALNDALSKCNELEEKGEIIQYVCLDIRAGSTTIQTESKNIHGEATAGDDKQVS